MARIRHMVLVVILCALPVLGCSEDGMGTGNESPTGTFLDPKGGPDDGYTALDEVCEEVNSPDYLKRFETPMFRSAVSVGTVAWLVDGSHLWGVDVSLPWSAHRVSLTRLPGHPMAVRAGPGNTVWIAAGEAGILVVDIGDPQAPELVRIVETPGMALDLAVSGNLAYVAMGSDGISVFDLTLPGVAFMIGQLAVPDFPNAIDVSGDYVYVASCASFSIVDASDPSEIAIVGSYWVPEGHARQLAITENYVLIAGGEALFAYDVTFPTSVVWTGFYYDPEAPGFYVNDVVVRGNTAYIAAGDESVRSVDISRLGESPVNNYAGPRDDTEPPTLDGPIELPPEEAMETEMTMVGDPIGVAFSDDLLLVLGNFRWVGERMIRILDISQPGIMLDVGTYVQPNETTGIDAFKDLFVLHGSQGQEHLVDIDGQGQGEFDVYFPVRRAIESEGWIYLLAEENGIFRWNEQSAMVDSVVGWSAYDMAISPDFGFASDTISNEVRAFTLDGGAVYDEVTDNNAFFGFSHLAIAGDALWVYDWATGILHVLDLTASGLPAMDVIDVGMCEMYDIADFYSGLKDVRSKMVRSGDQMFLMCPYDQEEQSSVLIFDILDDTYPYLAGRVVMPAGRFKDIVPYNERILALGFDNNTYESTLTLLGDDDPSTFTWSGHANGVATDGDLVLVVDGDQGLMRFSVGDEGELQLISGGVDFAQGGQE